MADIVADGGLVPTLGGAGSPPEDIRLVHRGAEAVGQADGILVAAEGDSIIGAGRVVGGFGAVGEIAGGAGHQPTPQGDDQPETPEPRVDTAHGRHSLHMCRLLGWVEKKGRAGRDFFFPGGNEMGVSSLT